jgi:hypothetical protein
MARFTRVEITPVVNLVTSLLRKTVLIANAEEKDVSSVTRRQQLL